ncbi:hypothetical protein KGM_200040 [Danaus plexippus plexippus]|uniref:Uncharacterized protein n=1 Tax=Danaus plexippus plexippus TaxID=278856 RepID=A0A212FB28_DANPL|nr:hypothetical protein KGM_200040 [Danaus plexippus plexippus]
METSTNAKDRIVITGWKRQKKERGDKRACKIYRLVCGRGKKNNDILSDDLKTHNDEDFPHEIRSRNSEVLAALEPLSKDKQQENCKRRYGGEKLKVEKVWLATGLGGSTETRRSEKKDNDEEKEKGHKEYHYKDDLL